MAITATRDAYGTHPVGGGLRSVRFVCTTVAGDEGGVIDTGFAYIRKADVNITTDVDAFAPKVTIAAPNITVAVGDGVGFNITVEGRGFV